LSAKN